MQGGPVSLLAHCLLSCLPTDAAFCTGPPAFDPRAAASDFKPSLAAITEAHKQAKYAASSLTFEDVANARKFLVQALKLLSEPS